MKNETDFGSRSWNVSTASRNGVKEAARQAYSVLRKHGSAVDAVVKAVSCMENDPTFDAGTGSGLTSDGTVGTFHDLNPKFQNFKI